MEDRSHTRVQHIPSLTGRCCGALLVVLALLADSSAGLMILGNQDAWGLLVHVPAALGWALGISVLNGRLPWGAPGLAFGVRSLAFGSSPAHTPKAEGRTPNAERHAAQADPAYLNRWLLTSGLLGLVLFPGLGPLGCTVGFGLSHLLSKGPQQDPDVGEQLEAPDRAVHVDQRVDPLRDLQIQPLVDILRQPNSDLKRAAIAMLGRRGSREAMRLVQGALTDPDPDVRSDAAVTLSRLEDDFNRALSQAAAQGLDSPHGAERYAGLCYRYATSDLLDAATSRYYLTQREMPCSRSRRCSPSGLRCGRTSRGSTTTSARRRPRGRRSTVPRLYARVMLQAIFLAWKWPLTHETGTGWPHMPTRGCSPREMSTRTVSYCAGGRTRDR